jgi:monoamine oxidase
MAELEDLYILDLLREEEIWTYGGGALVFGESGFLQTLDELYFDQIIPLVQLNSPVTAIDTSGPQPFATAAGENHYADAIIVTVSVGVLRNNHIAFNPPLPPAKVAALNTLNMTPGSGTAVVMIKWAAKKWPNNIRFMNANGPGNMCWFADFYKDIPNNQKLVSKCIVGPAPYAQYLDGLTEQQQIDAVASDIIDIFPRLSLSDVEDAHVANLGENPFFEGGYSSPGQGSRPDTGPSARQVYAEPVGTSLYFAGEGTKNNGAGSVSGALDSGLRVALEIDADHDPVPEPSGSIMLGCGILGLILLHARRQHRRCRC